MELEINAMLNTNDVQFRLDFDYWEKIMKKLKVYKAKALLKQYYERFCRDLKYKNLRKKEGIVLEEGLNTKDLQINVDRNYRQDQLEKQLNEAGEDLEEYVCVSPIPFDSNIKLGFQPIKENDDLRNLEHSRIEALKQQIINAKIELDNLQKPTKLLLQREIERKAKLEQKPKPKERVTLITIHLRSTTTKSTASMSSHSRCSSTRSPSPSRKMKSISTK